MGLTRSARFRNPAFPGFSKIPQEPVPRFGPTLTCASLSSRDSKIPTKIPASQDHKITYWRGPKRLISGNAETHLAACDRCWPVLASSYQELWEGGKNRWGTRFSTPPQIIFEYFYYFMIIQALHFPPGTFLVISPLSAKKHHFYSQVYRFLQKYSNRTISKSPTWRARRTSAQNLEILITSSIIGVECSDFVKILNNIILKSELNFQMLMWIFKILNYEKSVFF